MSKNQNSPEPKSELRRAYDYPSRAGIWFLIGDIIFACARRIPFIRRWRNDQGMVLFLVGAFALFAWLAFWFWYELSNQTFLKLVN